MVKHPFVTVLGCVDGELSPAYCCKVWMFYSYNSNFTNLATQVSLKHWKWELIRSLSLLLVVLVQIPWIFALLDINTPYYVVIWIFDPCLKDANSFVPLPSFILHQECSTSLPSPHLSCQSALLFRAQLFCPCVEGHVHLWSLWLYSYLLKSFMSFHFCVQFS